ncbi:MAG: peptide chain release factor N(5)-glutamine methyltransferase [Pseudomonadota bacterium]|nr:peptide chain release factor N(5)-glutamine methyltransferase [Pseudomonadota bacterium]
MQINDAIKYATQKLDSSNSKRIDSEILLCSILKCSRPILYAYPDKVLSSTDKNKFEELVNMRSKGYPIAYLTKQKEFWAHILHINENILIPRPETELLVEKSLELISTYSLNKILELGTGSGAIAISIASEKSKINIKATDISDDVIKIARKNANLYEIKNIKFVKSDWFNNIKENNYDLIVSNPPYISSNSPSLRNCDIRFEPVSALVSGDDGIDDLQKIIQESSNYLRNNGWLIVEHAYNQGMKVRKLFLKNNFTSATIEDYSKLERVTFGKLLKKNG